MELAHKKLDIYEKLLAEQFANGVDTDEDGEDDNPWTLFGSMFFAYTSITTIGVSLYYQLCYNSQATATYVQRQSSVKLP
jgi:hypothetical protein